MFSTKGRGMTSSTELHLKRRGLVQEDYLAGCRLWERAYPEEGRVKWSRRDFDRLVSAFPRGQLGIEDNGVLVAGLVSVRVDYTRYSDPDQYQDLLIRGAVAPPDEQGDSVYGLDVFVAPDYRDIRLGQRVLEACKEICRDENLKAILLGCRLSEYQAVQKEMSASEYIDQVERRVIHDTVLTFFLNNNFDMKR